MAIRPMIPPSTPPNTAPIDNLGLGGGGCDGSVCIGWSRDPIVGSEGLSDVSSGVLLVVELSVLKVVDFAELQASVEVVVMKVDFEDSCVGSGVKISVIQTITIIGRPDIVVVTANATEYALYVGSELDS